MNIRYSKQVAVDEGAGQNRLVRPHPLLLVGIIFGCIGLLFAVLGGVFMAVSSDVLPQVFTAEVWLEEAPEELELPIIGVVFSGIGLLFLLIAVIMLMIRGRQKRLREELLRFGTRESGVVKDIVIDRSYQVNNRYPLRILVEARHPFTGEMKMLRSPLVWETNLSTGDTVEVLFDPQDEKRYDVLLPGNGE